MNENVNLEKGISLESYLVGFVHHALYDIAESLAESDTNKATRKTYEAIEYLRQYTVNPGFRARIESI